VLVILIVCCVPVTCHPAVKAHATVYKYHIIDDVLVTVCSQTPSETSELAKWQKPSGTYHVLLPTGRKCHHLVIVKYNFYLNRVIILVLCVHRQWMSPPEMWTSNVVSKLKHCFFLHLLPNFRKLISIKRVKISVHPVSKNKIWFASVILLL
jgi:hypothetical protein